MKTLALSSLALALVAGPANAQSLPPAPGAPTTVAVAATGEPAPATLISGPIVSGGFGGPIVAYTRLNGQDAVIVGGRGGWMINHRLVIGGGGWGIANRIDVPAGATPAADDHQLTLGYGGLWTEYIVLPNRIVHASLGALVGAGGLTYHRFRNVAVDARETGDDAIFVFEPAVAVELNLASFVRVDLFAAYRVVAGVDLPDLENGDVAGLVAGGIVKFGWF